MFWETDWHIESNTASSGGKTRSPTSMRCRTMSQTYWSRGFNKKNANKTISSPSTGSQTSNGSSTSNGQNVSICPLAGSSTLDGQGLTLFPHTGKSKKMSCPLEGQYIGMSTPQFHDKMGQHHQSVTPFLGPTDAKTLVG